MLNSILNRQHIGLCSPPHYLHLFVYIAVLQWRKSNTLEATLKLLDDIQQVVDTPGKIDEALAVKVSMLHGAGLKRRRSRVE
jgi:hypothetical protein